MPVFREKTPQRRIATEKVGNYRDHRDNLREDFNHRCGYCDSLDNFRRAHYEIDHFIPKKFLEKVFSTPEKYKDKEQEYKNLVYACHSCNNAKGEKWPANSIEYSFIGSTGFIDPCKSEYDNQFERDVNGKIIAKTELGKWIHKELKLWKPEHLVIWHLDEISKTIKEIENLMTDKETSDEKGILEKHHYLALLRYKKYHDQLMEY